ncbi:hypothetical protein [Liquorilactobacillus vini]|uniref:hypothetical protein n=1 Tax=Liquorilactobacillus vini TaxID=238015 RepID=UPI0005549E1C|nr:hypothetical protein [Liquorilactobacillus vini]
MSKYVISYELLHKYLGKPETNSNWVPFVKDKSQAATFSSRNEAQTYINKEPKITRTLYHIEETK